MADPDTYTPSYSFTGYQAVNPTKPLPGPQLDNELANISESVDELVEAVKDVRRSDGNLPNGIVTIESLSDEVLEITGAGATEAAAEAAASQMAAAASESAAAASDASAAIHDAAAAASAAAALASEVAAAASATTLYGSSTSLVTIATGSKAFVTQAGKMFPVGTWLSIASALDPSNFMYGQVTAYAGTALTVNVTVIGGSGSQADWIIGVAGARGATGAPGPAGPGGGGTGDMLASQNLNDVASKPTAFATIKQAATDTATGVVELATDAEVQTGTDNSRAVTPASLTARTATTSRTGVVELATTAEVQTGSDADRAVTPATMFSCTATTTRRGVVELSTDAEVQAGSSTGTAITPAGLATLTATATRAGLVELATEAETVTGTDTARAATPAGVAAAIASAASAGFTYDADQWSFVDPSGYVEKGGYYAGGAHSPAITFDTPFPNQCFGVTATAISDDGTGAIVCTVAPGTVTVSGFQVRQESGPSNNNTSTAFYWRAPGR
jgi:hypothetical protein